jgi:hypothetical protein
MVLMSVITCPHCGHAAIERMPSNVCRIFYDCRGCGVRLKPKPGDCCVFCSYAQCRATGSGQTGRCETVTTRRFPPPWTVEELVDACFVVRDASGQALSYVYFEEEPGWRSAAKLLSKDEARRIAANIAKLLRK